jgi:hypothetical protein
LNADKESRAEASAEYRRTHPAGLFLAPELADNAHLASYRSLAQWVLTLSRSFEKHFYEAGVPRKRERR